MDGADRRPSEGGGDGLHAPIRLPQDVFVAVLRPKHAHGRAEGQIQRDEVDEVALPVDACLGVVGPGSDESGQVGLLLPVSGIIVIVDPVTKGSDRGRAFAGDDDTIPVHVDFESGRHHAEISHAILQPRPAFRHEGDGQRAPMIFRR